MGEWKGVEGKPKCDCKRKVKSDSVGSNYKATLRIDKKNGFAMS